jgi:hypothetical protein
MEAVDPTGGVAHLIQTALTPVFLLSGIAALLGVFNTRLAQVSDHLSHLADLSKGDLHPDEAATLKSHLLRLALRTLTLDASVALGAIGGAATCGAAFVLFLGSVRESGVGGWLIGLFSLALGCTVISLLAFIGDSLLAWHGLRREGPIPRSLNGPGK